VLELRLSDGIELWRYTACVHSHLAQPARIEISCIDSDTAVMEQLIVHSNSNKVSLGFGDEHRLSERYNLKLRSQDFQADQM